MHHAYIDRFAQEDSPIHRLDPRAKMFAVVAYSLVLISFSRYELTPMIPMLVLPLAMLAIGQVPLWFALRRVLVLSPLIMTLALWGLLYDNTSQVLALGPWRTQVHGGPVAAGSIVAKFAMGMMALTALTCTTPFSLLLEGMQKLGLPRLLVMQLGFLYRYLFVLLDEAMRIRRARDFRGSAGATLARRLSAAGGLIGSLFVRTLERSQRIHTAMCARGYQGQPHSMSRLQMRKFDLAFLVVVAIYLAGCMVMA